MNIDFPDYKPPFLANAQAKFERLNPLESNAKSH